MGLQTTTDPASIAAVVEPVLAADPVRQTVLGTVRAQLSERSWAAVTAEGRCVAVRASASFPALVLDGPDGTLGELGALLDALPGLVGVAGPTDPVARLVDVLTADGSRAVRRRMAQRLFRLDTLTAPDVAGRSRSATADDADLVLDWYRAFGAEAGAMTADTDDAARTAIGDGCRLWLDTDGRIVSLAARRPVVAGSARIGPVYTPPGLRGHGYGSAATAAATRDVLDEGAVPVLFTDLGNPVSNAIYPRLGYLPVEDRLVVTFAAQPLTPGRSAR